MTDSPNETQTTTQGPHNSTLIEFPGVNRNRPAWRKELSEKVREIQQRRAREAAVETGESASLADRPPAEMRRAATASSEIDPATVGNDENGKPLGLVPPPEAPEMNPLVVAALRRIERARAQMQHPVPRPASQRRGQAAVAARVIEEEFEPVEAPATNVEESRRAAPVSRRGTEESAPAARHDRAEAAHASNLVVVAAPVIKPEAKAAPAVETAVAASATTTAVAPGVAEVKPVTAADTVTALDSTDVAGRPQPRKIVGVIDDHWLERHGTDPLPKVDAPAYDDRAPVGSRVGAALIDLLAVAFLCAPFAAVIELTIGEWQDERVLGSMGGIIFVVMFLYHTCAVALAGRTWGMHMLSLHAVDANTASVPTTWQCARRALVYMLSLATFGLGLLYALFDSEGRTAHDILSRTVIVKE